MIAQTRPDIANVTEHTVLALKDLEGRIGVLKGDLAVLCQNLGHPEAARVAAAPVPFAGFGAPTPWAVTPSPWGSATPGLAPGFGTGLAPGYAPGFAPGFAPGPVSANPWAAGMTPFASAYGAFAPFGVAPWTGAWNGPWTAPWTSSPMPYAPTTAASPFAAVPAGYR